MLVSIIVPGHNCQRTIAACLQGCLQQTYPDIEVIFVDDGSTDDTPRIVHTLPIARIWQEKRGPASARNHGARVAHGEILVFTDSDCVPEADWIERLVAAFTDNVVAAGGTYGIANPENLLARMIHEEIRVRHARMKPSVDFLGSFNLAVRAAAFHETGGFDESYTQPAAEDADLSYRLHQNNAQLLFVPNAIVNHHHPTSLFHYLRTQARHGYWRVKLHIQHPVHTTGDQYAGWIDLSRPFLALAILGIIPLVIFLARFSPLAAQIALLPLITALGTLILFNLPMPLHMAQRTGDIQMLLFLGVSIIRDFARTLGMVAGGWTFILRGGKKT